MRTDYRTQAFSHVTVHTLSAGDNYIYVLEAGSEAIAVDPGTATGVLRLLKERNLQLKTILNTHTHFDHVGGNAALKKATGCRILAPPGEAPAVDSPVKDSDVISLGRCRLRALSTPGHGGANMSYYMEPGGKNQPGMLWTGDILFVAGCGRLFGQEPEIMWTSLQKIAALPPETLIYCGHEYTLENLRFAESLEPGNKHVSKRLEQIQRLLDAGNPTVPSILALERKTNPFLRASDPEMKAALGMEDAEDVDVFAELRQRKDRF